MAPLVELRAYFLLILRVRLVLGLLGLAAARALDVSLRASIWLFGLGAALFAVGMLTTRAGMAIIASFGGLLEMSGGSLRTRPTLVSTL